MNRSEYGGCSEVMGATFCARCICAALKLETPMLRIFPSALSFAISATASSIEPGEALSGCPAQAGQWI